MIFGVMALSVVLVFFCESVINIFKNQQMKPNKFKRRLYRKVNTTAKRVCHDIGKDYKDSKNKKRATREQITGAMRRNKMRGLDYTPLFRFLLSKVGSNWEEVHSEAVSRLDKEAPIFWLVALDGSQKKAYVRTDESTYFSGLFVDQNRILQRSNPDLKAKDLTPFCTCCTHTFNGILFGSEK